MKDKPLDKIKVKNEVKNSAQIIEKNILKRLGSFFYNARTEKDFTVRKLTDLSGVSNAVISDLENANTMPRVETIIKLALALGINDMDEMFSSTFIANREANKESSRGAWGTIKQCLIELDYNNAEIHRVGQYLKFLTYLKNNKAGIIPDSVRNCQNQQNIINNKNDK